MELLTHRLESRDILKVWMNGPCDHQKAHLLDAEYSIVDLDMLLSPKAMAYVTCI